VKTVLVPGVAWPPYKPTKQIVPRPRPNRITPNSVDAMAYIKAHPGCLISDVARAIGKKYTTVYDHVSNGIRVGRYRREQKGIVCVSK